MAWVGGKAPPEEGFSGDLHDVSEDGWVVEAGRGGGGKRGEWMRVINAERVLQWRFNVFERGHVARQAVDKKGDEYQAPKGGDGGME